MGALPVQQITRLTHNTRCPPRGAETPRDRFNTKDTKNTKDGTKDIAAPRRRRNASMGPDCAAREAIQPLQTAFVFFVVRQYYQAELNRKGAKGFHALSALALPRVCGSFSCRRHSLAFDRFWPFERWGLEKSPGSD